MRRIREAVLPFTPGNDDHLPKTVREFHQKCKGFTRILDMGSRQPLAFLRRGVRPARMVPGMGPPRS